MVTKYLSNLFIYLSIIYSYRNIDKTAIHRFLLWLGTWDLGLVTWDLGLVTWDLWLVTWDLWLVTWVGTWDLGLVTWDLGLGTCDLGLVTWDLGLGNFFEIVKMRNWCFAFENWGENG